VITSRAGAALGDIVAAARRRHPGIPLYVVATQVQGPSAAKSLVAALGIAQRTDLCDVVVVTRGGGSQVELGVYNDECVVRAIAACRLPVITAIGHERDVLLADEVADLRAATPSAAAERAIPTRAQLALELRRLLERLTQQIAARVKRAQTRLGSGIEINDHATRPFVEAGSVDGDVPIVRMFEDFPDLRFKCR
jgi:exodeoxyribonuclease VII large subunit